MVDSINLRKTTSSHGSVCSNKTDYHGQHSTFYKFLCWSSISSELWLYDCYDHFCHIQFMRMLGKSAWLSPCSLKICAGKGMANGFKLWAFLPSFAITLVRCNGKRTCLKGVEHRGAMAVLKSLRHIQDIQTWTGRPENRPFRRSAFTSLYSKHWTKKARERERGADSWGWCYCVFQDLVTMHFMNLHKSSWYFILHLYLVKKQTGCTSKSRSTPAGRLGCQWAASSPEEGTRGDTVIPFSNLTS